MALSVPLISVAELAPFIGSPDLRIVDASWHMPASGRNGGEEFIAKHIPGAVFFDIDAVSDHRTDLPHMLPTAEDFAAAVATLGISNNTHVVVYDAAGLFSAARLWWMFRYFGHDNVSVLDGGLPAWEAAGHNVESGPAASSSTAFHASVRPELVKDRDEVLANIDTKDFQVFDARGKERFEGKAAEPRAGMRSGHLPGSGNVPFSALLQTDGTMKPDAELAEIFAKAGWHEGEPTVTSCGSGVTACILALALAKLGHWNVAVYDGSWAEWGADETLPLEITP